MNTVAPEVQVEPAKKSLWRRASIVWLVPIVALLIALLIAWQSYRERGSLIYIEFDSATGVEAGATELRYRDVTVGRVEKVGFSENLQSVRVAIRVEKDVAEYIDRDARFWVVRPQLSLSGVSGLDTVLGGVYIEGFWDEDPKGLFTVFRGLEEPPLVTADAEGLSLEFQTTLESKLTTGAPILYKGVKVGQVGTTQVAEEGTYAFASALIYKRYRHLITRSTRFWDISGFKFSLGAGGASLDFNSISSLISGGVTFDTIVSGGSPVVKGSVFKLYANEGAARASVFTENDVEVLNVSTIFSDNLAGLTVEAPVELNGVTIGEVSNLTGVVDRARFGDSRVRLNVTLAIQPARLGLEGETTPETALVYLNTLVENGLRARLARASILTGGLKVEMTRLERSGERRIDLDAQPFPIVPSTRSQITDVSASAEGVFERINSLPVEEVLQSAITFMKAATRLVEDPDILQAPQDVRGLIGDVRGLVTSRDVQEVPERLNAILQSVETLTARLEQQKVADKLVAALGDASEAANSANIALAGAPELMDRLNGLADKVQALPLDELVDQATGVLASADAVIGTPQAVELPKTLNAALVQIKLSLEELRGGGAIDNANRTMAAARNAAEAVSDASGDLPGLVARANRVLGQAATTLQSYDNNSALNRSAREALREIRKAADAVANLARTIQRKPNSLLLGR